ncbi:MAG TPA: L,D-transpeptidase family protein [Anaerolineales bacterium]|nr:L,D-transpeptidase family protein [Anaerolineales bacterium]
MSGKEINRREFMKFGLVSAGGAGLAGFRDYLPPGEAPPIHGYGRIAWDWLPVRKRPTFYADEIDRRYLDQVIPLLEVVEGPDGPAYNPRWYRIVKGFIYSGYIQPVETRFQIPARSVPRTGALTEVTVPYTDSLRFIRNSGWNPLYRLYYRSTHWVTSIDEGPDGTAWYGITSERHGQIYHVPAEHLRLIPASELDPISPDIPAGDKHIEISINRQTLTAYEGDQVVLKTKVATGLDQRGNPSNGIPTNTPKGSFRVSRKMPVRHMGNGDLVSNLTHYELPGVPWVSYFVATGVALHGAWWHNNFGRQMSKGCVNMTPDDAKWMYRWTTPTGGNEDWYVEGAGTVIRVF